MKKLCSLAMVLCLLVGGTAMADVLGEYPVVTEPLTMTGWGILANSATNTFNENASLLFMEELTGIHFDWDCVTIDGQAEKRALKLASGELPDVFFRGNLSNDELSQLALSGQIIPLDDLIAENAPNLLALMDRIEGLEGSMKSDDGHIYALSQVVINSITTHYIVNEKWLDNVGMEVPTTLDEFYDVLVAFKEQDANGNGDPNDEIPLSVVEFEPLYRLMTGFGVFPSGASATNGMYVYPGTDEVKYAFTEDGYKDAMHYFRKLYEEGLLDAEFLVQDGTTLTAKGTANTLGALSVAGAFVNVGDELHFDYQGLAPFPDENGNRYAIANAPASGNAFVITANCPDPAAAVRWVDYLYSEEGAVLSWGGVEGETYEWIDEDTWDWILPEGMTISELRHSNAIQGGTSYPSVHPDLFPGMFWSKQNNVIEASLDGEQFRKPQTDCAVTVFPTVKLDSTTQEEITFLMTDIEAYMKSMSADFITGVKDIDASWEEYVSTIEQMGVADAVSIYQGLYDNYQAMNP